MIPLLSRAGCNARECHGSFQGRGGFRLSLFGYDFEADHKAITQDADGGEGEVRVNLKEPAKSLLVMKPTVQMKHKGKERIHKDSWEHQLLLRVGAAAAVRAAPSSPRGSSPSITDREASRFPGQNPSRIKIPWLRPRSFHSRPRSRNCLA